MPLTAAVLAAVGDEHVGSTIGLCPPDGIELEDGGRYMPNVFQLWMWERWLEYWDAVDQTANGLPIIAVSNGEFIDGNHHRTTQIATPNPQMMIDAAVKVWRPIAGKAYQTYATKGTEAHIGAGGASDSAVAGAIEAQKDPDTRKPIFDHLKLVVAGVSFSIAHHVSSTARMWTHGNNIRTEVLEMMDDARDSGQAPPDYVIRGHVHKFSDTGLNYRTRGLVLPAWQGLTGYVSRLTRRENRTVGGVIIKCQNGKSQMELFTRTLPGRAPIMVV